MLKSQVSKSHSERRQKLMSQDSEATYIFFGANARVRSYDSHFPFRQDSDFYYLTGFDEEGAALILTRGESWLFVLDRDPDMEVWNGERYGKDRAKSVFGVTLCESVSQFYPKLDEALKGAKRVYFKMGAGDSRTSKWSDKHILEAIERGSKHAGKGTHGRMTIVDPTAAVAKLRVVKDAGEIELMRKAARATALAHEHLLRTVKPGMTEFDAMNEFQYSVFKNGCNALGYEPIFASGKNATTLHYNRNNEPLHDGDLLLVDAAGELDWYTADLTQTFPIGRKFSLDQRKVYEKVLGVNRAITAMMRPGVSYRELHQKSCELLTEALLSLGALKGSVKENLENKTYRQYYMHGLGHFLGIDVHDAGIYDDHGIDVPLQAGMVITNEPGLYFRDLNEPYGGIGVRIEDDILITPTGCEVLTRDLVRDVDAIEALRAKAF